MHESRSRVTCVRQGLCGVVHEKEDNYKHSHVMWETFSDAFLSVVRVIHFHTVSEEGTGGLSKLEVFASRNWQSGVPFRNWSNCESRLLMITSCRSWSSALNDSRSRGATLHDEQHCWNASANWNGWAFTPRQCESCSVFLVSFLETFVQST